MTLLTGPSELGIHGWLQAEQWARERGATLAFVDNARRYWTLAEGVSIRPEVAYAQSGKETGFGRFGGVVTPDMHNWCGLKVARPQDAPWPPNTPDYLRTRGTDYNVLAHEHFDTDDEGVRQHLNHLNAYAFGHQGVPLGVPAARRAVILTTSWAGTIRTVEDLWHWNGRADYPETLMTGYLNSLMTL